MRRVRFGVGLWLSIALAAGVGVTACKSKDSEGPDQAAIDAQKRLVEKRDALLTARQKLQAERDKVVGELTDVAAKGGDVADLKKQLGDIDSQLATSSTEVNSMSSKLDAIKISGDKSANLAAREADLGGREKTLADREARLADRERQLAQRESESAQRWKDSCQVGAPVVIQSTAKPGGNYGKKDVSDLIQRAKSAMVKKGILTGDLPGPTQTLEADAAKAMGENDYNKAYFAAAQLAGQVDAIQINRAFIQTKMARIQSQLKAGKVDDATNKEAAGILSEVMLKYNDGDFAAANRRLNQLAGQINR